MNIKIWRVRKLVSASIFALPGTGIWIGKLLEGKRAKVPLLDQPIRGLNSRFEMQSYHAEKRRSRRRSVDCFEEQGDGQDALRLYWV